VIAVGIANSNFNFFLAELFIYASGNHIGDFPEGIFNISINLIQLYAEHGSGTRQTDSFRAVDCKHGGKSSVSQSLLIYDSRAPVALLPGALRMNPPRKSW
jgi:hypothetical protein